MGTQGYAVKKKFNQIADAITRAVGSPSALILAATIIVIWAVTGPIFNFSDTWQLVINTGTTIVTFLMVFVIQNAANRDAKAVHIKLDELITSIEGARNRLVFAESQTEEEQDEEIQRLAKLAEEAERNGSPAAAIADVAEAEAKTAEAKAEASKLDAEKASRAATTAKRTAARTGDRQGRRTPVARTGAKPDR